MQPPSGNVTFLFTDIEGSTQLWDRFPEAMAEALAQHDTLVRAALGRHQGFVFKTIGDAFCAAFNSAGLAARAAVAIVRDLATASWGATGPLRVRVALHSGEAEQRDQDYFGPTLNRSARLLAAAHGGQILLSLVTAEMVREHLELDCELSDLGEHFLKDLSRPEHVFQLWASGLARDFPPLRSLAVLPNNLPTQMTSLVGRTRELAEVKRLLGKGRLLTLTGPGGTGKTRLSLEAAADVLEQFPHGVWLVELATLSDPALLAATVANVLDIREEHDRSLADTLIGALRTRKILLVLDNCEHLVDACARLVAAILPRSPGVTILASSREALNVPGEAIFAVPPLAVAEFGPTRTELPVDRLAKLEAVQLFVERATAVRSGFALTPDNASLIARICWRLDGIPLAIELAAARIKVLPLEQILSRLDDRFRLLSTGSRTALPRQQTLSALIDWSYDLLSEPERILLRRLTVFVAGRTLPMVEEVCSGDGLERQQIFDLLSALVDKSLLVTEEGWDGETRYTMLESLWDYGDEKLLFHREALVYRKKHLDHFMRWVEAAEPGLYGADQQSWLERIGYEHYNITTALRFSAESSETVESGLRLAGSVARYWEVRSYLAEGLEHFRKLLDHAGDYPAAVIAKAEFGAGRLSWSQDRAQEALVHYRKAQAIYHRLGMGEIEGMLHAVIGYAELDNANPGSAQDHFGRAAALGEQHRSRRVRAMADNGRGALAADEGRFGEARRIKEGCLVAFRALEDDWAIALVLGSLGRVCVANGDFEDGRAYLKEALTLGQRLGNKWAVPYAFEALATICVRQGNVRSAVRLYGAASAQREALALKFSPKERTAYDASLHAIRSAVSDGSFDAEWEKGRNLSLAETFALAHGS